MNTVDIFEFSRHRREMQGDLGLQDLKELAGLLKGPDRAAQVRFFARGVPGDKGLDGAELTVEGTLTTQCVRCGRPVTVAVSKTVPFLFARSEADADRMPVEDDGDWEIVVGSQRFDVVHWVEEELILSLPSFPKHEDCEMYRDAGAAEPVPEEPAPRAFAGLRELLGQAKKRS